MTKICLNRVFLISIVNHHNVYIANIPNRYRDKMKQTTQYLKNFSERRSKKAKAILEKGNPKILDEFTYFHIFPSEN